MFCSLLTYMADAQGKKADIQQIHEATKNDPSLAPDTMSEEKKKELIDSLLEHHSLQLHGACTSNLAAAQDTAHTVRHIEQSVSHSYHYHHTLLNISKDVRPC